MTTAVELSISNYLKLQHLVIAYERWLTCTDRLWEVGGLVVDER